MAIKEHDSRYQNIIAIQICASFRDMNQENYVLCVIFVYALIIFACLCFITYQIRGILKLYPVYVYEDEGVQNKQEDEKCSNYIGLLILFLHTHWSKFTDINLSFLQRFSI